MPKWAGLAHQSSSAGAGAKAKAKAKGRSAPALGSGEPKPSNRRGGAGKKGGDPELERLALERDAILKTRKWKQAVVDIGGDVVKTIQAAESIPDADPLADVVRKRFAKFVALAPAVELSPPKRKVLSNLDHEALREALTPVSKSRTSQLSEPTKKGLVDYDKNMSSVESSIQKAMKSCTDHVDKVKLEEAKQQAKKEKLEKQRLRHDKQAQKALQKAQEEGVQEAAKAALAEGHGDDGEADDDNDEAWALVQNADELLVDRFRSPCVRTQLRHFFVGSLSDFLVY